MTLTTAASAAPPTSPAPRAWWRGPARHHDRPAEVLAVLQQARAVVEAGWVQNRWLAAAPAPEAAGSAGGPAAGGGVPEVRACVVGAVALAVRSRDPRADLALHTGPALAFVWDAVHGRRPGPAAGGRSAPPAERVARMRELARWNDAPGRTRADVVAALDRAAAAVVARTVEPVRA